MSLQRELLIIFLSLFSIGFFFRAGFLTLQQFLIVPSSHPLLAQAQENTSQSDNSQNPHLPIQVDIPQQGISTPLVAGSILDGSWQVSAHTASLLTKDNGLLKPNSYIMYGHNSAGIFGKLDRTEIGDVVEISFPDGSKQAAKVASTVKVSPQQLHVLDLAQENTILLYTCVGLMDSQRFVVLAQIIE